MDIEKPPVGLKPKWIHDLSRMAEVLEAIGRYAREQKPIPEEWFDEANELMSAERTRQRTVEGRNSLEHREALMDAPSAAAIEAGRALRSAAEAMGRAQQANGKER